MRRLDNAGFTLLEAVVALAIVSVVAVAALAALGAELRTAARARSAFEAAALAEDRLAVVRMLDRSGLARLPDSLRQGRFPPPLDGYRWTATSRPVLGEVALYDVVIRVAWESGDQAISTRLYRPVPEAAQP